MSMQSETELDSHNVNDLLFNRHIVQGCPSSVHLMFQAIFIALFTGHSWRIQRQAKEVNTDLMHVIML